MLGVCLFVYLFVRVRVCLLFVTERVRERKSTDKNREMCVCNLLGVWLCGLLVCLCVEYVYICKRNESVIRLPFSFEEVYQYD